MVAFWILMAVAAAAAGTDWVAVAVGNRRLEYAAKPTVLVALVAAAAIIPADHTVLADRRAWFVVALACCLVGDVLLMLPRDLFVPGLAAFLGGHVFFIVGLLQPPAPSVPPFSFSTPGLVAATVAVLVVEAVPATLLFRSLADGRQRELVAPVALYLLAISTMVVLAVNVGILTAGLGAVLFLVSDTLLAWNRFIRPIPSGPVGVHVTYHAAQILLVLSLLH